MAETDQQDKQFDPTPRRRQKAREQGDIPRSKELNTVLLLLTSGVALLLWGNTICRHLMHITEINFTFERDQLIQPLFMWQRLCDSLAEAILAVLPVFIALMVIVLVTPWFLGGWIFSSKRMAPKFSKLNPLSGMARLVSKQSLIELLKASLKFTLILCVGVVLLVKKFPEVINLGSEAASRAVPHALHLLLADFLTLSAVLILFAAIDIPYQLVSLTNKLKMTHQEMKDELKETDVNPETKARVKQVQQAMAQKRMFTELPTADVILTNPSHYAVALRYETKGSRAPVVIAKGADLVAERIIECGKQHGIEIMRTPPLTRSLYFNTELFAEIPAGLFAAVAQVLAYIYQLKRYRAGFSNQPVKPVHLPIPEELRHDPDGAEPASIRSQ